MSKGLVSLFVRLPPEQVDAIDRLTRSTGRRKQQVVSELLAERLPVGAAAPGGGEAADEVLTLDEVAGLLRVPPAEVQARAAAGDLPARRLGDEWRFLRSAVLAWLGGHGAEDFRSKEEADDGREA